MPGETMAFEVRLAGITAGEAQLAVGEVGELRGPSRDHRQVTRGHGRRRGDSQARHRRGHHDDRLDTGRPLALETFVERATARAPRPRRFVGSRADITYTRDEDRQATHDAHRFRQGRRARRPLGDGAAARLARHTRHDEVGVRRRRPSVVARRRQVRRREHDRLGARQPPRGALRRLRRSARRQPDRRGRQAAAHVHRVARPTTPIACRSRSPRRPSSATS